MRDKDMYNKLNEYKIGSKWFNYYLYMIPDWIKLIFWMGIGAGLAQLIIWGLLQHYKN